MSQSLEGKVREIGVYIVQHNATVRSAASYFGCSKSAVHKYMTDELEEIDSVLYAQVRRVLDQNKAERHIRGGQATKQKYLQSQTAKNL